MRTLVDMAAKVLIVDDDPVACEGLGQLLRNAGYQPLIATAFHEARTALRNQKPDFLIVDVRLGSFNGLQLVIEAEPKIPAIVVSGFSDPTIEEEARKAGAEFMIKPIVPATLLTLVQRKLEAPQSGRGGSVL